MPRVQKPKKHSKKIAPTDAQLQQAYEAIPELIEPDRAARRAAFILVILLVIVVGAAGAAIEIFLKPLLAQPLPRPIEPARELSMMVTPEGYVPSVMSVRSGETVKWVINATRATDCGNTLIVPDLNINQLLTAETIIEFTASTPGRIPFSCASTRIQGYFEVK